MGVGLERVTLHVGAGTFLPVKTDDTADHRMHAEWGEVDAETAARAERRARGRRAHRLRRHHVAAAAGERGRAEDGTIRPFCGETAIFITPGYRFRAADGLMTNFHLPKSTLFMLVSAFAGQATMREAYAHAIADRLSLLLLWRLQPALEGRLMACVSLHRITPPTAARAPGS